MKHKKYKMRLGKISSTIGF
jgi:hypothetical protein